MATTLTGTVGALKRLFENGGDSKSVSFINNHDNLLNGVSRVPNGSSNFSRDISLTRTKPLPVDTFSNVTSPSDSSDVNTSGPNNSSMNRSPTELPRVKPIPPKVKPKPVIYRKIVPAIRKEPLNQQKVSIINTTSVNGFLMEKSLSVNKTTNESRIVSDSLNGSSISSASFEPKQVNLPAAGGSFTENGDLKIEGSSTSSAQPTTSSNQNSAKKPPPVSKKPRSILSGYSNASSRAHYKYDEALEKQFGLKVDQSSYDFTERWAAHQAERTQELAQNKTKRSENDKVLSNETQLSISRTSSVSSSTGVSGSNFTNSSIRSILKKGRPSLGVEVRIPLLYK